VHGSSKTDPKTSYINILSHIFQVVYTLHGFGSLRECYTASMDIQASFSGLSVDNIAKAKEFYVDVLGCKLTSEAMGLELELPGGNRHFIYEKADHEPATFTVLNFVVSDIDAAADSLIEKGVTLERYDLGNGAEQDDKGILRGRAADMGPDIAWFKDPAGNVLSILQD
jgi:catechol 2,3-dioxygenase-like lactoylglutathione lyase family enzyme